MPNDVIRPALRYHGGKWKLAPWIVSHFGPHTTYTEAFGGGASVLLRKGRALGEVYNDLDSDLVNLFRVLRDPLLAARLQCELLMTPYAREEFEAAYEPAEDAVEQARRLVVRSFMGFGSAACNPDHRTGFRAVAAKGANHHGPATEWSNYADVIPALTQRLRGVLVENKPAADILQAFDGYSTLHFVDPTYPTGTRPGTTRANNRYRFEMTDDQHRELAAVLHGLKGLVVLSGYACDLYDKELFANWHRIERETHADGARPRLEVLWLNDYAAAKMNTPAYGVFSQSA